MNLSRSPHEVAPELIGAELYVDGVGGVIVEVEAYDHQDPASHGFRNRRTARNALDVPAGRARVYVYRSYGIHWCLNIVCERKALPMPCCCGRWSRRRGSRRCGSRRGVADPRLLCSGPGRLCQALARDARARRAVARLAPPFELRARPAPVEVVTGTRIGITKAAERPWRYGLAGSRFLSRPFPASA